MSTKASSTKSRPLVRSKLNTVEVSDHAPITYARTVSKGRSITGSFRISGYSTKSLNNSIIPVERINTFQEYMSGCKQHERCLGPFCTTPGGNILLPQKLASAMGDLSNQYANMVENVFIRDVPAQGAEYKTRLKDMMLTKKGKMRGDMLSGTVDGSMREVIAPYWTRDRLVVGVPRRVAKNMKVLRVEKDTETGLYNKFYKEDHLREGDFLAMVRPPSITHKSVQPMKVVLWDHECLGLPPSHADEFHADHDGDEMHGTFLTFPSTLEECEKWEPMTEDKFATTVDKIDLPTQSISSMEDRYNTYMSHTTLSIKELCEGVKLPQGSRSAKVKEEMASMFVNRYRNQRQVVSDFMKDSVSGIVDIMNQRLTQGDLGDMSRQARLAASCVSYKGDGVFLIKSHNQNIKVVSDNVKGVSPYADMPLGGNPCIRAVNYLCSIAQQAALDSHRVSREVSTKMDLVGNMIKGDDISLVAFENVNLRKCKWKSVKGNITYALVVNNDVRETAVSVVAAYNPVVLNYVSMIKRDPKCVKSVCRNGILMVCNYYGVTMSPLELEALTELMSYKPEASVHPITTKKGMYDRCLKWMVTLFANHFGMFKTLQDRGLTQRCVKPDTATDAAAFGNYDYV